MIKLTFILQYLLKPSKAPTQAPTLPPTPSPTSMPSAVRTTTKSPVTSPHTRPTEACPNAEDHFWNSWNSTDELEDLESVVYSMVLDKQNPFSAYCKDDFDVAEEWFLDIESHPSDVIDYYWNITDDVDYMKVSSFACTSK